MKVGLIFLTIFVAYSRQQYQQRMLMDPWLPPVQQLTNGQQVTDNRYSNQEESRLRPMSRDILVAEEKVLPDFRQLKAKGLGYQLPSFVDQNEKARFLLNAGSSSTGNPLVKTVTFTVTSTCIDFTFETCVPRALVLGAAPIPVNPCRRKRLLVSTDLLNDHDDSQYSIVPSQIHSVEPTTYRQLWPAVTRDSRQILFDIGSSKEELPNSEPEKDLIEDKLKRKGRFFYLWQSFATGTTVTSWFITSSTKTSTLVPLDAAGALAPLPCLPTGYKVC